jgi:hypothetical protein
MFFVCSTNSDVTVLGEKHHIFSDRDFDFVTRGAIFWNFC